MTSFIILISKGRIFKDSIYYIKNFKINFKISFRKLYIKIKKKNLYLLIIKNKDIKLYFKKNITDFYFIGKDLFYEKLNNNYFKYYNVNISKSRLCFIKNKFILKSDTIYTKYKNIIKNFIEYKNFNFKLKFINSSVELLLNLNISNIIADIISSYKTLKINKLFEIKNIINFNLIIIINRDVFYKKIYNKFFYKISVK